MKNFRAVPVTAKGSAQALAAIKEIIEFRATSMFVDLVELRLDLIDDDAILADALSLCQESKLGMIITYRAKEGASAARERERRHNLLQQAIEAGVAFIDVDLSEGKEALGKFKKLTLKHGCKTRLIVSHHDFTHTPPTAELNLLFNSCLEAGADVIKIVTMARSYQDNLDILNLFGNNSPDYKAGRPLIAFCMGELGCISRIAAPTLGSLIDYIAMEETSQSASGQITLKEALLLESIIKTGRGKGVSPPINSPKCPLIDKVTLLPPATTAVFALLGNPVAHSLSPLLHNTALREMNINGVYIPFCVDDVEAALNSIRALGIKGVSVTLPFKVAVIPFLDELDAAARKIGAVNTIINNEGKLIGHNTDWSGALAALQSKTTIAAKTIAILGAGGTARALCYAAQEHGAEVLVVNRSVAKGEELAREFGAQFCPLSDCEKITADILINTTPLGMYPHNDVLPLPVSLLKHSQLVMDVIYNPLETRLLQEARKAGIQTLNGVEMFVRQGVEQIELWTGRKAPLALLHETINTALTTLSPQSPPTPCEQKETSIDIDLNEKSLIEQALSNNDERKSDNPPMKKYFSEIGKPPTKQFLREDGKLQPNRYKREGANRPPNRYEREGGNRPPNRYEREGANRPPNRYEREGGNRPPGRNFREDGKLQPNRYERRSGNSATNRYERKGDNRPPSRYEREGGNRPPGRNFREDGKPQPNKYERRSGNSATNKYERKGDNRPPSRYEREGGNRPPGRNFREDGKPQPNKYERRSGNSATNRYERKGDNRPPSRYEREGANRPPGRNFREDGKPQPNRYERKSDNPPTKKYFRESAKPQPNKYERVSGDSTPKKYFRKNGGNPPNNRGKKSS